MTGSSRNMKSTMAGTSPRVATRSWTSGARAANTAWSKSATGHGAAAPVSQGRDASMNSPSGMARMYSPFIWVSLATSKKAGEWLTSSRRNHSIICVDGDDLLTARRAPSQQGQVVDEGLRQVALVPIGLDRHWVASLGQLLALRVDQHGQMSEDRQRRGRPAGLTGGSVGRPPQGGESLPGQHPLGGGGQQVLTPDHVGDGHVDVVDHVGQDEQRGAVGLDHHEVVDGPIGELDLAPDDVVDHGRTLIGGAEAKGPPLPPGQSAVAAEPVVARGQRARGLVARLDLLSGAVAGVEEPAVPQGVDGLVVAPGAQRLAVGALVGVHPQPVQGGHDPLHPFLTAPLRVGVLDAQHEGATGLSGHQPVEQGGACAAHMEETGR